MVEPGGGTVVGAVVGGVIGGLIGIGIRIYVYSQLGQLGHPGSPLELPLRQDIGLPTISPGSEIDFGSAGELAKQTYDSWAATKAAGVEIEINQSLALANQTLARTNRQRDEFMAAETSRVAGAGEQRNGPGERRLGSG